MQIHKNASLTDTTKLCLECGLCCTGVFHDRARLYSQKDKECAKTFNASIHFKNGKEYFSLPCPIFDGKCPIYPHNPSVCQMHECDLLKDVHSYKIKLEKAIAVVHETKEIINKIECHFQSLPIESKSREITFLFEQFFASTSTEGRKNSGNILKEYLAFLHLRKKYFYKKE